MDLESSRATSNEADPPPGAPPASFYHEQHEQAIRQHELEPIDRAWGPQTAQVVQTDIERLGPAGGFQIRSVDCRTATCSAVVRWPTRGAALDGYRWLLLFPLRANCERTIVLPEPTDGDGEVQATLLLDCNSWRADGSNLFPEELIPPLPVASQAGRPARQGAPGGAPW